MQIASMQRAGLVLALVVIFVICVSWREISERLAEKPLPAEVPGQDGIEISLSDQQNGKEGRTASFWLTIVNRQNLAHEIANVIASCNCVVPKSDFPLRIAPDSSAKLKIEVDRPMYGRSAQHVTVVFGNNLPGKRLEFEVLGLQELPVLNSRELVYSIRGQDVGRDVELGRFLCREDKRKDWWLGSTVSTNMSGQTMTCERVDEHHIAHNEVMREYRLLGSWSDNIVKDGKWFEIFVETRFGISDKVLVGRIQALPRVISPEKVVLGVNRQSDVVVVECLERETEWAATGLDGCDSVLESIDGHVVVHLRLSSRGYKKGTQILKMKSNLGLVVNIPVAVD